MKKVFNEAEEITKSLNNPHPNVEKIAKTGHKLTEREQEMYADFYVKFRQGTALKMFKVFYIILVILVPILIVALDKAEGGYPMSQTLPLGIGLCVVLLVLFLLSYFPNKKKFKRQGTFTDMKELVFHSDVAELHNAVIRVYEWEDDQLQINRYSEIEFLNLPEHGTIIYRFTNQKGEYVLIEGDLVDKGTAQ